MNKNGYVKFDNYIGSTTLGSGIIPKNTDYPLLIQSSNVQIDEEGHSLYDLIESGEFGGGNGGSSGEGGYDGDTGSIDYTTVWQINNVPDVQSLPNLPAQAYRISFTSNNTSYIGILGMFFATSPSKTALRYMTEDDTLYITAWSKATGWSNDAYKTITIHEEITDEGLLDWLNENATLISGSVDGTIIRDGDKSAEMPTIRFVDFKNTSGKFIFSVEIIGGSKLHLGDYFELCAMRTCKRSINDRSGAKRQRLRKLHRSVITDTSKNVLTLAIPHDDAGQLFKNDRNGTEYKIGCRSPIYLRIKRPFFDENGYENYAKFSNVIRLEKSYSLYDNSITIK
jgi:hypothetical protein